MINDIINEQWQGHSHGEVEAALKLILQQMLNDLEQGVEPGSIGREQLTQALKDAIDSIATKVSNTRRINGYQLNADVTIGTGDIKVGNTNKTLSALLDEMQEDIEHAGGSGVTQQDIDDAIAALVDGAPETLDTLKELAAALNNTPNAITALTNLVDTKQDTLVAGNGIVVAQDGKTVSVDAEVVEPENADGTFAVRIGNNTYSINLNHEHPQYQPLLTAGSNITITTDPQTGEVTISAAGGGGGGGVTVDSSITGANQANPVAGGAIYTALQGKANASEMSIDAVSGDSTKMTIQLKSGVAQNVVTQHQSLAGRVQSQDVVNIVKITQSAYDALQAKDSTTLYLITES